MNCLMPFYKYISSSFFFLPSSPPISCFTSSWLCGLQGFGGGQGERRDTPHGNTLAVLWCGVFKPQFSFLPTNLCPDSTQVSYSARRDTNSGQKQKVNYLVHSCSVFIFIVVQGSYPSCPPRLFWLWHTFTHPFPHRHTTVHVFFLNY